MAPIIDNLSAKVITIPVTKRSILLVKRNYFSFSLLMEAGGVKMHDNPHVR